MSTCSRPGLADISFKSLTDVFPARPTAVADGLRIGERVIPIRGGIIRFRDDSDYNESFHCSGTVQV
jgi:hypothetical protein